ncbi:hypothetical protein [Natronococcus wangiae]|uniref:hypothetical protein n=1 Tax=Natronococcus wangiae TaxID=3068275 RepID=UPI00273F073B|nr:hypothetical protein [Natronococcus sp. AD5]
MTDDTHAGYKVTLLGGHPDGHTREKNEWIRCDNVEVLNSLVRFQADGRDIRTITADRLIEYESKTESDFESRFESIKYISESAFGDSDE